MLYRNESYSSIILEGLNDLRLASQLCDVVFKVGGSSLSAHRNLLSASSPYFYAMFNGHFPESDQKNVVIQDVDATSFGILLDFIYTGSLEITPENVQNLLSAACFFQIHWVEEKSCEYLESVLDERNCLEIKSFAERHSCRKLSEAATKLILAKFPTISNYQEFFNLEIDELQDILNNEELYNYPEDVIFKAIMRWTESSLEDRSRYLHKLLQPLHPSLLSTNLLAMHSKAIETQPLCSSWASKATDEGGSTDGDWNIFILDKIGKTSDFFKYNIKSEELSQFDPLPKKAFAVSLVVDKHLIYVQGGSIDRKSTSNCFCYNVYRNKWIPFTPLIVARSHHRSCILNGSLYAIGGNGADGAALYAVERLDLFTGVAKEVEQRMLYDRTSMGAVAYENCLYVMGGENEDECLYSMERFDPREGKWCELASMDQINSYCSSAIVSDKIFCSEGLGNYMERYDLRGGRWELIEFPEVRESYELFSIEDELYSVAGWGISKYCSQDNTWSTVLEFSAVREWDTAAPSKVKLV